MASESSLDVQDLEMLDDFYTHVDYEVRRCLEQSNQRFLELEKHYNEKEKKLSKLRTILKRSYEQLLHEKSMLQKKEQELMQFRETLEETRKKLYEREQSINKRLKTMQS